MTYAEEKRQELATLARLASEIGQALGGQWLYLLPANPDEYQYPNRYLIRERENGYGYQDRISIGLMWNDKTRAVISGVIDPSLREHIPYKAHSPEITVRADRDSKVIAREIERRVLPEYTVLLGQIIERKRAADQYEAKRRMLLTAIAEAVGEPERMQRQNDAQGYRDRFHWKRGEVYANDSVIDLKLEGLTLEQALRVLRAAGLHVDQQTGEMEPGPVEEMPTQFFSTDVEG